MPTFRTFAAAAALAALTLAAARRHAVLPPQPATAPTFDKEIVRIFQSHCQTCHHPGDIGPFSLMTYASTRPEALKIKLMTQSRQMPPWKPTAGCGDFADPRVLSQNEIDLIAKWVDAGAPEGNAADLPAPLQFDGGWALGQPDLVLKSAQAFQPAATGDTYRCFTLATNSTADQYVSAIDVHPGDRDTVHHVIAFIDTTGASANLDGKDGAPGYRCFGGPGFTITSLDASTLGGWAPGARPVMLPEGVAFKLPAASRVVLQVHYHPHNGVPAPDQTELGVYFAKTKPAKLMRVLPLINDTFTIPPNDPNYRVTASFTVPALSVFNAHLWVIAPHMHLLGRRMHVTETLPTGESKCLIDIPQWDFNWQGMYRYNEPVAIPAGTTLSLEAFYDNSADNPLNPNAPPKPVSWGEATTDEMCITFFGITLDSENLAAGQTVDASWLPKLPR